MLKVSGSTTVMFVRRCCSKHSAMLQQRHTVPVLTRTRTRSGIFCNNRNIKYEYGRDNTRVISFSSSSSPPSPPSSSKSERSGEKTTAPTRKEPDRSASDTTQNKLYQLLDTSCTGTGQVIFLNSSYAGKILLGSLAVGDPYLAVLAFLGSTTSTLTAQTAQLNTTTTTNGLYSYNGCLVGCATAVFVAPQCSTLIMGLPVTLVGATASTFVTQILSQTMVQPQWTIAFNLVTLTMLLRVQPLLEATTKVDAATTSTAAAEVAGATATSFLDLLLAPLVGLSQIFVVESAWTGMGIVAALASYSPQLAGYAVTGSLTGSVIGYTIYGVAPTDIAAGLWGFNPALTALGVGVFFEPTQQSRLLAIGGAAATAAVFGTMQTVFGMAGSPCLTLPFCLTMSGCYLLGTSRKCASPNMPTVPGLILAQNPHSPEKNSIQQ